MATRDGIEQGLVCIYSVVEPCRTFSLRWQERHYAQSAKRKCVFEHSTLSFDAQDVLA